MMSLPWARVMVCRRMGTAIMAIWEWEASRIFHMVGTMWLCCNQMNNCLNLQGSYTCSCDLGYFMSADNCTCLGRLLGSWKCLPKVL